MKWLWTCLEYWVVMILDPCESHRHPSGESREAAGEADGLITCISLRIPWAELARETHRLLSHRAEWGGVVVCRHYQRRGIARALLQETLVRAASWGIELVTVGVRGGTGAEQVYHRLGFREYARLPGGFKEVCDGKVTVFDDVRLYLPAVKSEQNEGIK